MFFKRKVKIKSTLEKRVIRKIINLKENNLTEETIIKLNDIIRDYLKVKFKISRSLTHEEVISNLNEKRIKKPSKIDLFHLLTQIYQKEYFPHYEITPLEIKIIIKLAIKTLKEIETGKAINIEEHKNKKPKIKKKQKTNNKQVINKNTKNSSNYEKIEKDIASIDKNFKIDWKNKKTIKTYEKIRQDYSKLEDYEKNKIYPKIISLFKLKNN